VPEFENELSKLNAEIRETTATEATSRAAADQLVAEMRESGADLRAEENFAKIDVAYRDADAAKDKLLTLRTQQARYLEIAGGKAAPATRAEGEAARSFADRLNQSAEMRGLRETNVLKLAGARVNMDPVMDVITRDEMEASGLRLRTTFDNSANVGSGLLTPDYTGKLVEQL
jgi:hypothetical protein